jgi:hypothetical protein
MNDSPRHTARCAFTFGDIVYLRCRKEHVPGMVTQICLYPRNCATYIVTWGNDGHSLSYYDFELTTEFVPDFSTS